LKVKVVNEQEFVIAGFTKGERDYFGALVLSVRENGKLRHAGQVGTGFDQKKMKAIYERLKPLVTKMMPFPTKPNIREGLKNVTWVKPELVCQVRFLEWTRDGLLRAPVFVGLREDKAPEEIVREMPANTEPQAKPDSAATYRSAALDFTGRELTTEIDGHRLKFTNLDKVFFPNDGWQKRDLLHFYEAVALWLLPHLADRPLSMKRYPNGIESEFFFQKNAGAHFPDWMRCEPITEHHPPKVNHYPIATNRASLLYLVNLGCIDQNPWMSRTGNLEHPDWILLDLDPVETPFDQIIEATLLVREILKEVGLRGYAKTTGGDGMHVYVPIDAVYTYDQVRSFAELLSHLALEREPNLFTTPRSVDKRKKGRVYFDYLQIGIGKTIAAPYVVRAYNGAPVATPLDWKEVKRGLRPTDFRIDNTIERFKRVGDLFSPVLAGNQRLEDALERIGGQSDETASAAKAAKKAGGTAKKSRTR
jgi:bifunctional non-homologous end joining protein LigD